MCVRALLMVIKTYVCAKFIENNANTLEYKTHMKRRKIQK